MATSSQTIKYRLRQMNNEHNSAHLLWFPKVQRTDTLSKRGIVKHIAGHGTVYTRDVVDGVITKFRDCLIEKLTEGVAVKLDGLGTFYPSFESKGAESPVGYNIRDYLRGVHIRFLPETTAEEDISSRTLKESCHFTQTLIIDKNGAPKKVVDGQVVDWTSNDDDSDDNTDDNNNNEG